MWSSTAQYAPSSNGGAYNINTFTRCGGKQSAFENNSDSSWQIPPSNPKRGEPSFMDNEYEDHSFDANSKYNGSIKNVRKSTACETELDFSGEFSKEVSQKGASPSGFELKKPSLLLGLKTPQEKKVFENFVLEEDEDQFEISTEGLGKRTESAPCQQMEYEFPEKKLKGTTFNSQNSEADSRCNCGHKLKQLKGDQDNLECELCQSLLNSIRRFVEERGGKLLSTKLSEEVELQCDNGHLWTVPPKKATKSWCKECKKKRKQVLKDMLKEEAQRKEEELKNKQQKLLEDLRQKMLLGEQQAKKEEIDTFKIIYDEITRIASKYAREYCLKDSQVTFEQTLLLYQTLIIPDKNLSTYFQSLSKDDLRKEFRRYTISLHPDKNSHPKSKQAFQKSYNLFSLLLSS